MEKKLFNLVNDLNENDNNKDETNGKISSDQKVATI